MLLFLQALNRGDYYQQQQYYNHVMSQNTQSMQNLNLNQQQQMPYNQQSNQYSQNLISPNYKVSSIPSKSNKKVRRYNNFCVINFVIIVIFLRKLKWYQICHQSVHTRFIQLAHKIHQKWHFILRTL